MINYKFSGTQLSFYPVSLLNYYENAGTLPDDLADVTDEVYNEFMGTPPSGMVRGSDSDGQPFWVKIPSPTREENIANASALKGQYLEQATDSISPLQDAVDLGIATDEEIAGLKDWKTYRVAINRVDPTNAPNISWPIPPAS